MQHVYRNQPSTINELKEIVEDFIESIDPDMIRKACASARKRFQMLSAENGGRLETREVRYNLFLTETPTSVFIVFQ